MNYFLEFLCQQVAELLRNPISRSSVDEGTFAQERLRRGGSLLAAPAPRRGCTNPLHGICFLHVPQSLSGNLCP
jgi:hypothetical protein